MRSPYAFGVGAALALMLLPTFARAQYEGPIYGGPEGPGPYGYGPPGMGYGAPYGFGPRMRRQASKSHGKLAYHGYRIGLTNSARSPEGAREAAGIEHQLDIVNHAGLSARDLQLFRSKLVKSDVSAGAGHSRGGEGVTLGRINYNDSRPVLLHEFMHVYHRSRLPGGFNNPTVLRFYEEAVASGAYPQGSYMLQDQKEFFAMTASAYLHGTVARPPYNRETIREAQPAYYAYLASLFGPR